MASNVRGKRVGCKAAENKYNLAARGKINKTSQPTHGQSQSKCYDVGHFIHVDCCPQTVQAFP